MIMIIEKIEDTALVMKIRVLIVVKENIDNLKDTVTNKPET